VVALARFFHVHVGRRAAPIRRGSLPKRRHSLTRHIEQIRTVLPAMCAIGIAAVAGWLLAGGGPPPTDMFFGQPEPALGQSSPGDAPVHIDSTPSGAQVRIDGARSGSHETPLDVRLSPGQHSLSLEHPDALEDNRSFHVAEDGAVVDVALWRRHPGCRAASARVLRWSTHANHQDGQGSEVG
jgi:hypothetical protein